MAKSPFYARIKDQVLQLTAAIPSGRVCTFQSIGEYLDVVPRHVAYILSQLGEDDKIAFPWHRVVGKDGSLGTRKENPDGRSQADLLRDEGHPVDNCRIETSLTSIFISAEELPSGLPRQKRPPNAPRPNSKQPRSRPTR